MAVVPLLLAAAFLVPQGDETVRDFKRYFRKAQDTWERVEYIRSLEQIDDPGVAEVLLPLLDHDEPQVADAAFQVLAQLPSPAARSPFLPVLEKGKPPEQLAAIARAAGEGKWAEYPPLLRPHLEHKDDTVRLWTATSLGLLGDSEALAGLAALVTEDPNPLVRVAAVDALGRLGRGHEGIAGPPLVAALDDPELEVQVAACLALRGVRVKEAVEPLIRLLEEGEGRILEYPYPTLIEITDLEFLDDPRIWRNWWERAKDTWEVPSWEEVQRRRAAREAAAAQYRATSRKQAEFMGIDTPSERIVFVVDVSGSMEDLVVDRDAFRERGFTRFEKLEIVKEELARTIENLDGKVRFNIYAFASRVHAWRKDLVPANGLNRRSAMDFVRKLKPIGGQAAAARASAGLRGSSGVDDGRTNTYAALLTALGVADKEGRLRKVDPSEEVKAEVDTIFFLSDGRPSVGELVDPDDILESITELNRFRRVAIHTIAIGEFQKDFMQDLARQNGGVFVDLGR